MIPWIVIPIFDEAMTIAAVVAGARRHAPVLVIDDGSRDDGGARAAAAGAEVLRHPRRLGKGQALRTGLTAAQRRGATHAVTLDGDGQHATDDVPPLLQAAAFMPEAIIVGCRVRDDGTAPGLPRGRLNAIHVAGFFINWVSGLRLRDSQSGFRVYPLAEIEALRPRRGGFVFETEILVAAATAGCRVIEVPVTIIPRAGRPSRFHPFGDGVAIGAYLAAGTARRWALETRAAVGEVAALTAGERTHARHAAMLQAAAVHGDSFAGWGAAMTAVAVQRASARVATWWRHPRRRRAAVTAQAMAVTPVLLVACAVETVARHRGPDVVSPLVRRMFAQHRLAIAATARAGGLRRASLEEAPS